MKKIVLTGGGSAGHVTPHLALLPTLKEHYEIHYIGSKGIEKTMMQQFPYVRFHEITCTKLTRSFTLKNMLVPFELAKGWWQAKQLLKELKPNIIFSKGGYVSVPVALAAKQLKLPLVSHESDFTMGLANKIILKLCSVMCCTFEQTAKTCVKKCVFSGTPIRSELFNGNKTIAQNECKFTNLNKPCVLVMGGSLGAVAINKVVLSALPELLKCYNIIHIVGKGNLSGTKANGYYELEFTNHIEHFFALCEYVVSRSGSNSIHEFLALQKPMILIPLPTTASRGDQILNANEFEKLHVSITLLQEQLTNQTLLGALQKLHHNKQIYLNNLKQIRVKNGTNTILKLIEEHSISQ